MFFDFRLKIEAFISTHWGDFLLVGLGILMLDMMARAMSLIGLARSGNGNSRREAWWYGILPVGIDLCLLGISGLFVADQLSKMGRSIPQQFILHWMLILIILLFSASLVSAFSERSTRGSFLINKDCWLAIHIPNALGIVAIFIAACVILEP